MFITMQTLTEADQEIIVQNDSDNPNGIVVTILEPNEPKHECRLYLGSNEIEHLYKMMKDVDSYRGIK